MAARLTDRQKKKIISDYVELGSYNAAAKVNGVSDNTVRKLVLGNAGIAEQCEQKREQNRLDMLAYMDSRMGKAQEAVDLYLEALTDPEKIQKAPLEKVATALGIVVDKFTKLPEGTRMGPAEDDPLTTAIKEAVGYGLFQKTGDDPGISGDGQNSPDL